MTTSKSTLFVGAAHQPERTMPRHQQSTLRCGTQPNRLTTGDLALIESTTSQLIIKEQNHGWIYYL